MVIVKVHRGKRQSEKSQNKSLHQIDNEKQIYTYEIRQNINIGHNSLLEVCAYKILSTNTLQPHYNTPHYNAVFIITRPCHGSEIDYFTICL